MPVPFSKVRLRVNVKESGPSQTIDTASCSARRKPDGRPPNFGEERILPAQHVTACHNPKTVEQLRSILPACRWREKNLASLLPGQQRRLVKKPLLPLKSVKLNSILGAFAAAFVSI